TLLELNRLAERTFKHRLEVDHNRRGLSLGALRIATLPRLELMFLRRTARADLVLLVGRHRLRRRSGIRAAVVVGFRHVGSRQAAAGLAERCSSTASKVSPDPARTADLPV